MARPYKRKDALYQAAKEEGFRSRAAFKLQELNQRFRLIRRGDRVIDLGAWPGGWLQVAARATGPSGQIIGIDLVQIEDFQEDNIRVIKGDVREEQHLEQALTYAGQRFDVLLSDMSPKLTGIKEADRAAAEHCAELALWAAQRLLRTGGRFAVKLFKSNEAQEFVRGLRPHFEKVVRTELKSTRKSSQEFYVVGVGFRGESIGASS